MIELASSIRIDNSKYSISDSLALLRLLQQEKGLSVHLSMSGKQEAWEQGAWSPRRLSDVPSRFLWEPCSSWPYWCAARSGRPLRPSRRLTSSPHPCLWCYSPHPRFRRCTVFLRCQGLWLPLLFLKSDESIKKHIQSCIFLLSYDHPRL